MALYSAIIRQTYLGQEMQTSLYFRDVEPTPPLLDPLAQCIALGEKVRDNIVAAHLTESRLSALVCRDVIFTNVLTNRFDPVSFENELLNPVSVDMGFTSLVTNLVPVSPATCYVINVSAGARTGSLLDYEPKRGYKVIGPAQTSTTNSDGTITTGFLTLLDNYSASLKATLDLGGGFSVKPIIIGTRTVLGVKQNGFSDIINTTVSGRLHWRESRVGG